MNSNSNRHLYVNMFLNGLMIVFIVSLSFLVPFFMVYSTTEVGTTYLNSFKNHRTSQSAWFYLYNGYCKIECTSKFGDFPSDIEFEMCLNASNLFLGGVIVSIGSNICRRAPAFSSPAS